MNKLLIPGVVGLVAFTGVAGGVLTTSLVHAATTIPKVDAKALSAPVSAQNGALLELDHSKAPASTQSASPSSTKTPANDPKRNSSLR